MKTCAGVYYAVRGNKKQYIIMLHKYVALLDSQLLRFGSFGGLFSVISTECTGYGVFNGLDGGKVCQFCKGLRKEQGSRNPSKPLNGWFSSLSRCIERKQKEVLTKLDIEEAEKFGRIPNQQLTPDGMELKEEALAQVVYGKFMLKLTEDLPFKTFKSIWGAVSPRCGYTIPGCSRAV